MIRSSLGILQILLGLPPGDPLSKAVLVIFNGHVIIRVSPGCLRLFLKDKFTKIGLEIMLEKMETFRLGYFSGGYDSLIIPVNPTKNRTVVKWPYRRFALRVQVVLEEISDLKRDLNSVSNV